MFASQVSTSHEQMLAKLCVHNRKEAKIEKHINVAIQET